MVKNVRLPFPRNACGHAEVLPQVLTGQSQIGGTINAPLTLGRSVDWQMAEHLNGAGCASPELQQLVATRRKSVTDLVRAQLGELFNCRLNHLAALEVGHGSDGTRYSLGGTQLPSFRWFSYRIYADGADGQPIPYAVELNASADRFQMALFEHLLDRIEGSPSPSGGTLLDDCGACWTNDLGSGPSHDAPPPWTIAGAPGGTPRTGQVVDH